MKRWVEQADWVKWGFKWSNGGTNNLFFKQKFGKYQSNSKKAELPFGHIKRNLGAGQFLLRGKEGVNAEISIFSTCFIHIDRLHKIHLAQSAGLTHPTPHFPSQLRFSGCLHFVWAANGCCFWCIVYYLRSLFNVCGYMDHGSSKCIQRFA